MELKIYVDRLKNEKKEVFAGSISSDFLPSEKDLSFQKDVEVSGEAYIAGDHLIIKLKAKTSAYIPCSICNNPTQVLLTLPNFYHAEPLQDLPSTIFDFSDLLRADLLLMLPAFSECKNGCPERKNLTQYLKKDSIDHAHTNFPFSSL